METTDLAEQLIVGDAADGAGDGTVVDDGRLCAVAAVDMTVHAVVARVQLAADEPAQPQVRVEPRTSALNTTLPAAAARAPAAGGTRRRQIPAARAQAAASGRCRSTGQTNGRTDRQSTAT